MLSINVSPWLKRQKVYWLLKLWLHIAKDTLTRRLENLKVYWKCKNLWPLFIYICRMRMFFDWVWVFDFYPTNCVRSGNLNPWKVKADEGLERATLCGGGRRSTTSLELVLCRTNPHWALHTSSLKMTSRGHSRASWAQSVILNEAHWGWKRFWVYKKVFGFKWIVNLLHHLYKCSWCRGLGKLIRRRWCACLQSCNLEQRFRAKRSSRFVALSGMERVDS